MPDEMGELGANLLTPEKPEVQFASNREQEPRPVGQEGNQPTEQERVDTSAQRQQIAQHEQVATPEQKDDVVAAIEEILADKLVTVYQSLPEDRKPKFKQMGEKASAEISAMVHSGKVQPAKVLKAIEAWLGVIPNVNVYFLQQAAKIKTDSVLDYAQGKAQSL